MDFAKKKLKVAYIKKKRPNLESQGLLSTLTNLNQGSKASLLRYRRKSEAIWDANYTILNSPVNITTADKTRNNCSNNLFLPMLASSTERLETESHSLSKLNRLAGDGS